MDLGKPFQTLEKAFTDPNFGRVLFLVALVSVYFLIDYDLGFTHHYDISSTLSEIERLKNLDPDTSQTERIDSLYTSVIGEMESRRKPIPQKIGSLFSQGVLSALVRLLSVSFGFLTYTLYSLLWGAGLKRPKDQAIGAGMVTVVLLVIGLSFPSVGGLGGTASALIGVQFTALIILMTYGNLRRST